ncbi:MAG: cation diffusion facilitator family transporter [Francisellaceae bacterium]
MDNHHLESKTLTINLCVALAFSLFSLVIVYFVQSLTVLLDTGYSVVSVLIYAVSLYVVKKMNQPANKRYPYGYHRLEPMFVILESGFVLFIAAGVIVMSLINLISKAITPHYGFALLSELTGTFICFIMFFYIRAMASKTGSKILAADAELWKADTILGGGVSAGILIGYILDESNFHHLAIYVDPSIAIILGVFITIKPLKLLKEAYRHILDSAPTSELNKSILDITKTAADHHRLKISDVKSTQSGRHIFVDIRLSLPEIMYLKVLQRFKISLKKQYKEKMPDYIIKVYIVI